MKKNTVKLNEARLKKIVVESVKKILSESNGDDAYDIYKELCQIVGVREENNIEAKPRFQLGKAYLIFSDKYGEGSIDLKKFAKYFVRENNLSDKFLFDIKGFSDDNTLWVEVFRKNLAESVRKVLNEGVNPEIVNAMKQYLFATRNLRVLFSREDVAYGTTQGMNWEDMLTNIEGEIMEFLEGC